MSTTLVRKEDVTHDWYHVDATGKTLGRLAVQIANILRGRNHPLYTPHVDTGDFVIVTNARKIKLTGKKMQQKSYMFYTGYMGNEKHRSVKEMLQRNPRYVVERAVKRMLPSNNLSKDILRKLKVYGESEHPHAAQQPKEIS